MSTGRQVLEGHLQSGRFLSGALRGRWELLTHDFPIVIVAITARDGRKIALRFDCVGYPDSPPTATAWDAQHQRPLSSDRWPRGGRVSQVFNPGWKNGTALYLPCDRQSIEGHTNWYAEYPWLIWKPAVGLVHYIEAVHEVLQSHELLAQAVA
jgi:hypothetical protein